MGVVPTNFGRHCFLGTSINSPFCKIFNNYWISEHFCGVADVAKKV